MKAALFLTVLAAFCVLSVGCGDTSPTLTANDDIETGKADSVRAEIRMGGGSLRINSGSAKLLSASYRYSERAGRPLVHYGVNGSNGLLTVESPATSATTNRGVNEWNLNMGSAVPLDIDVKLGGGEANLDLSRLPLQSAEVQMGGGEITVNLAGKYPKDVPVHVTNAAGETRIRLPKDMGAVVDATVQVGQVKADGLTNRDGKYYNAAYAEGKPAVRVQVRSVAGGVTLSVE